MKKLIILVLLVYCIAMRPFHKTKVIFFGDYITQRGINKGVYIHFIQEYLNKNKLHSNYELIGKGVGGNKIHDLYLRVERDVFANKPDIVVIYESVYDVRYNTSGTGAGLAEYEKSYIAIIKKLQAKKIKLLLVTPACIGELKANGNPWDAELNKYCDVIRKLAKTYNCGLVDLRQAAKDYGEQANRLNVEKGLLTIDGVYLNVVGHLLVANELMKELKIL